MDQKTRVVNFLAILTVLVVAIFMGASVYALVVGKARFPEFSTAVGTIAGMLVGYWVHAQGVSAGGG